MSEPLGMDDMEMEDLCKDISYALQSGDPSVQGLARVVKHLFRQWYTEESRVFIDKCINRPLKHRRPNESAR